MFRIPLSVTVPLVILNKSWFVPKSKFRSELELSVKPDWSVKVPGPASPGARMPLLLTKAELFNVPVPDNVVPALTLIVPSVPPLSLFIPLKVTVPVVDSVIGSAVPAVAVNPDEAENLKFPLPVNERVVFWSETDC